MFVVGCHCHFAIHQWNGGLRSSSLNSFIFEVISLTFLGRPWKPNMSPSHRTSIDIIFSMLTHLQVLVGDEFHPSQLFHEHSISCGRNQTGITSIQVLIERTRILHPIIRGILETNNPNFPTLRIALSGGDITILQPLFQHILP